MDCPDFSMKGAREREKRVLALLKNAQLDVGDVRRVLRSMTKEQKLDVLALIIESLAAMLRNSSEEDMAEMAQIFGEAMAKMAEERAAGGSPAVVGRTNRSARSRGLTAAERRRQRRLAL